jgi:hypothetical protein
MGRIWNLLDCAGVSCFRFGVVAIVVVILWLIWDVVQMDWD